MIDDLASHEHACKDFHGYVKLDLRNEFIHGMMDKFSQCKELYHSELTELFERGMLLVRRARRWIIERV